MRRQHRQDYPELSTDDWYVVADAFRAAESCGKGSLFSFVTQRLKSAIGLGETPPIQVDDRTELLRDFVVMTRRNRRPADDLTAALLSNGFSSHQVAALALLADPLSSMNPEQIRHPA